MKNSKIVLFVLSIILVGSCSHKYDSNTLGLDFYQWNLWQDEGAVQGDNLPSCGWDELHRGKGELVRIPASLEDHFQSIEASSVFWYHCRFTLPEQWEEKKISMVLKEAGPVADVFLNGGLVGSFQEEEGAFKMDVSDVIYYIRDNHLSIRITGVKPEEVGKSSGITETILLQSGS
jgi:beta-galactosidase/beta-glucuronidase